MAIPYKSKMLLRLTEDQANKLEELKANRGIQYTTDMVRVCIMETYRHDFPNYVKALKNRKPHLTPEQKMVEAERLEALKKEQMMSEKRAICKLLEGQEVDGYCQFTNYSIQPGNIVQRYPANEPLETLQIEMVNYQYRDLFNQTGAKAKEAVLKLLEDEK